MFVFGESIISGANLWSGARVWTAGMRQAGLRSGDRVLIAMEPSQSFLWVLIAALCEELSVVLYPPGLSAAEYDAAIELVDPAATVFSQSNSVCVPGAEGLFVSDFDVPDFSAWRARQARLQRTPELRLFLRTSGSVAGPRLIALTDRNLFSVIDSHHAQMDFTGAVLLSVLPWYHAFGLVLELLPALLFEAEVFRDPAGGRQPAALRELFETWDFTHCNGVPALFARLLAALGEGNAKFGRLKGVVGGAPVSAELAAQLKATRLRAGYGQTQAGPGIMLGEPGEWSANFLGRPTGCEVRLAADGELEFRGANVCAGEWGPDGLIPGPGEGEFFATGDLVERREGAYYYRARKGFAFKLANGRWFHPEILEERLKREMGLQEPCIVLPHPVGGRLLILCADQAALPGIEARLAELAGDSEWPGAAYVQEVRYAPAGRFIFQAKGDLHRSAMLARFAGA